MENLVTDSAETATTTAYAGASQGAIKHHYDVGNDFWSLWLDPRMTYSCALWESGDTLDTAQLRKLDFHIDSAHAAGARRVLDVGCGWGSMLGRLLERGSKHVTGLTLSKEQHDWIAAWKDDRVEVKTTGWADYEADAPFNSIISVGAFEHFARPGMTRAEKVDAYRSFFDRCHGMLQPGSWLSLQTIAKGDVTLDGRGLRDYSFIMRRIFPESDLPRLSEVTQAIEGRFELVALHNDRWDYVRTCEVWLRRLNAARSAVLESFDEELFDVYARYLEACIHQFADGHAVLLRFALRRIDRGAPLPIGGVRDGA
jgi:cyclopropane-fatty-acyl-phospholipid synthase